MMRSKVEDHSADEHAETSIVGALDCSPWASRHHRSCTVWSESLCHEGSRLRQRTVVCETRFTVGSYGGPERV